MRTTLTLDEDVARELRRRMRRSGESLKAAVNEALRRGLAAAPPAPPPLRIQARALGTPGANYDCIAQAMEELDGPAWR